MLSIFSLSAGQFSIPMASIEATPIGLLAHTPPSTSSIASLVICGFRNVGAAAVAIAASSARLLVIGLEARVMGGLVDVDALEHRMPCRNDQAGPALAEPSFAEDAGQRVLQRL